MSSTEGNAPGASAPPAPLRAVVAISRFLSIAAVLAMLISVSIEVIGRSFFGHATIWVTEVTTYLVVAITFLGAAFVVGRDANVRVDLLPGLLVPSQRRNLMTALTWISICVTLTALWATTGFWRDNFESGARSWSLLNTPLWIPQLATVAGLVGLTLALGFSGGSRYSRFALAPLGLGMALALLHGTGLALSNLVPDQIVYLFALLSLLGALFAGGMHAVLIMAIIGTLTASAFLGVAEAGLGWRAGVLILVLFFLLFSGLPVVFTLMAVGMSTMVFWLPPVTLNYIGERAWGAVNSFELAAIPMFVMMGAVLVRSNASQEMFAAAQLGMGRLRGGLAYASIIASGIFAAVSGSSLSTAATMGRVAGPEMISKGYRPELAYGVLAAGGTLGILIPPSIAMIVYGPLAGVPITELFMAGIVPGLLLILAFACVVVLWTAFDRSAAPVGQDHSLSEKLRALKGIVPFLALIALVLGSLYAGIATPTEAGAVGVLGALCISLFRGTLSVREVIAAVEEAALATSFLLLIAVGASIMGFAFDFLALPRAVVEFINGLGLSDLGLFSCIVVLFLILGMFVEPISMVLMTLPILLPVLEAAGWDLLWFGVVLVMLVEIGLITPPVGMILYVLSGMSGGKAPISRIALGTMPFVGAFLAMLFLLFALPGLVTFLPEMMR